MNKILNYIDEKVSDAKMKRRIWKNAGVCDMNEYLDVMKIKFDNLDNFKIAIEYLKNLKIIRSGFGGDKKYFIVIKVP